jgi:hypothetical protein
MCGCCGVGLMLVTLAEEKARQSEQELFARLAPTKKLVDPKAKPWDDVRVWSAFLNFFGRTA